MYHSTHISKLHRTIRGALLAGIAGSVVSCSIGPQTVPRDRISYGDALAISSREELLKNIVRVRYMESPVFMSINSVVNQYSLESTISAGASWDWGSAPGTGNAVGAASRFSDRPTITYSPLVGSRFTESILTPIRPESLMALIESGWKVGTLYPLMVHSINGIRNRFYAGITRQDLDPKFNQIVDLMTGMQDDGTISIRVQKPTEQDKPAFVFIISIFGNEQQQADIAKLKMLLGLDPDLDRYRIVFGAAARDGSEIAMVTRSILAILADMSAYVQIPEAHLEAGLALPGAPDVPGVEYPLTVKAGTAEPDSAYVKIRHKDTWFWIEDSNIASKRTFFTLMLLSTLAEAPDATQAPLLTIPTG